MQWYTKMGKRVQLREWAGLLKRRRPLRLPTVAAFLGGPEALPEQALARAAPPVPRLVTVEGDAVPHAAGPAQTNLAHDRP